MEFINEKLLNWFIYTFFFVIPQQVYATDTFIDITYSFKDRTDQFNLREEIFVGRKFRGFRGFS